MGKDRGKNKVVICFQVLEPQLGTDLLQGSQAKKTENHRIKFVIMFLMWNLNPKTINSICVVFRFEL